MRCSWQSAACTPPAPTRASAVCWSAERSGMAVARRGLARACRRAARRSACAACSGCNGTGRDGLCHAGAVQPSWSHAALCRCADCGRSGARGGGACKTPIPQVAGQGIARLHAAGIEVECGLMEAAARELNIGFFARMTRGTAVGAQQDRHEPGRAHRAGQRRRASGSPARRRGATCSTGARAPVRC